jgi:PAS domain-containing protein
MGRNSDMTVEFHGHHGQLSLAINALREKTGIDLEAALDGLTAPIYVTDPHGVVTYFNPSCTGFAGRTPIVGKDRWCVTWKLYDADGTFLPHDCCPMAQAIKEQRPIRGVVAIAERPDGTRVKFMPYPTPLISTQGELLGAVNMLIDVTDERQIEELNSQAARCRRLADCNFDAEVRPMLISMAKEYEEAATMLARAHMRAAND